MPIPDFVCVLPGRHAGRRRRRDDLPATMFGGRSHPPPDGTASSVNYSRLPTADRPDAEMGMRSVQLKEQDGHLTALAESASRLADLSLVIGEEIEDQNRMLDEVERDMDRASEMMDVLRRKTAKLVAKSGGCAWFSVVATLGAVMVVLLFLVVYT